MWSAFLQGSGCGGTCMAKKGNRLREFEKNHRVLDISTAQEARRKKKEKRGILSGKGAGIPAGTDAAAVAAASSAAAAAGDGTSGKRRHLVKLIGMVVVVIFVLMVVMSVKNIFDLKEEERALKQRNEELIQLREELLMELNNVNSREYIEEQARKELKLVKGNELIFYFPDDWEENVAEKKDSGEETGKDE